MNNYIIKAVDGSMWQVKFPGALNDLVGSIKTMGHFLDERVYIAMSQVAIIVPEAQAQEMQPPGQIVKLVPKPPPEPDPAYRPGHIEPHPFVVSSDLGQSGCAACGNAETHSIHQPDPAA